MIWRTYLEKNPEALDDYREYLQRRRRQEEQAQDDAVTWEAAKAASGRKKLLDEMIRELVSSQQEASAHERYVGKR